MDFVRSIAQKVTVLHEGSVLAEGPMQRRAERSRASSKSTWEPDVLETREVHQYYGSSHTLRGTSLTVPEGTCTCVMGRNGVGKTTLLRAIMGLVPLRSGSVKFGDRELVGADASERGARRDRLRAAGARDLRRS